MFLEKSKSRIEAEFAKRAAEVPAVKEAEKEIETYRPEVALALKFLYTTMPMWETMAFLLSWIMPSTAFSSGRTAPM